MAGHRERSARPLVSAWPARKNRDENPFQALLTASLEREGFELREFHPVADLFRSADIWHWHWPEGQLGTGGTVQMYLRYALLRALMLSARIRRIPIVWTAHNLRGRSTAGASLERRFKRRFQSQVSGIHYLSEASEADAIRLMPGLTGKPTAVTMHGHYRSILTPVSRADARSQLGLALEGFAVVFVGKIERYKGVEDLLIAFRALAGSDLTLVIAGKPDGESDEMLSRFEDVAGVRIIRGFLSTEQLSQVLAAADLAVFPFAEITNSGSVFLALSAERPILVPAQGSMSELADAVGSGWVQTYDGALDAVALGSAIDRVRSLDDVQSIDLSRADWDAIALRVSSLYRELLVSSAGGRRQ